MFPDNAEIAYDIQACNTTGQLRQIRDSWHSQLQRNPPVQMIMKYSEQVNFIHDCFIKRAIFLAEQKLLSEGMASPSVSYAFILVGSGGREEQTPWSDQDNAIIYDDRSVTVTVEIRDYFCALGRLIVENLKEIGYPPCDGEVGADNERWCKPYSAWIQTIDAWLLEPNWENIRYLLIAADLRCVAGDHELVKLLQNHIVTYADTHPVILQAMLNNTLRHKIVLNVFGQLLVEPYGEHAGSVDIKYGGYIPIINSIRLVAILSGVTETSSVKRIMALYLKGDITEHQKTMWYDALRTVLYLRAQTSFEIVENHYVTAGMIPLRDLSQSDKLQLKMALHAGRKLQKFVQKRINKLGG